MLYASDIIKAHERSMAKLDFFGFVVLASIWCGTACVLASRHEVGGAIGFGVVGFILVYVSVRAWFTWHEFSTYERTG